ncbi:hypothetical protein ACPOM7_19010 [Peribacillus castrilensis]|uniref:hypothetical protein n=1 Tax=Peribacillus TaxID=2675229 RepID=UPI0030F75E7E
MKKYFTSQYQLKEKKNGNNFDVWSQMDKETDHLSVYIKEEDFIYKNEEGTRGTVRTDAKIELF